MVMNVGAAVQQRSIEDMERLMSMSGSSIGGEEQEKATQVATTTPNTVGKPGLGRAGQRLKQRIAAVMALLSNKETGEDTRKELEERKQRMENKLALHQYQKANRNPNPKQRGARGAKGLRERIARLTKKIENEKDPHKKDQLETRKATVEAKLKAKTENKAKDQNKPGVAFPVLTKRLANVEEKLSKVKDDAKRAELEKRKNTLLARLETKKASQNNHTKNVESSNPVPAGEETTDDDVSMLSIGGVEEVEQVKQVDQAPTQVPTIVVEDTSLVMDTTDNAKDNDHTDNDPLKEFPVLAGKLAAVNNMLQQAKNEQRRAKLEHRKNKLLARLAAKQANRQGKNNKNNNNINKKDSITVRKHVVVPVEGEVKKRLQKIDSKLAQPDLTEQEKKDLIMRKAGLLIKMAEEQHNKSCSDKLSLDQVQNVYITPAKDNNSVKIDRCIEKSNDNDSANANKNKNNHKHNNVFDNKKREQQKQRLIQMEKKARANNNQEALNRIALQQVYVAHYPDSEPQYVPVFAKGKGIVAKRAVLRAQAMEAVRDGTTVPVDWIAPGMYQRLPRDDWTLEDETAFLAAANNNKNNNKNSKEAPTTVIDNDDKKPPASETVEKEPPASEAIVKEAFVALNLDHIDHDDIKDEIFEDTADQEPALNEEGWTEVNIKEEDIQAEAKDQNQAEAAVLEAPKNPKKPKGGRRTQKMHQKAMAKAKAAVPDAANNSNSNSNKKPKGGGRSTRRALARANKEKQAKENGVAGLEN